MDPLVGSVLIEAARKVGAPLVKSVLERFLGGEAADIGAAVIDSVAEKLGVPPDKIPAQPPERIEAAVAATEDETPELIAAEVARMKAGHAFVQDKATPAWVPAWQWFIMALWAYSWVLVPVVNTATGAAIERPSIADLISLTTCYQVLNMGGNTVLRLADKARDLWGARPGSA